MKPYNPLDFDNLGISIVNAMESQQPQPLESIGVFPGAGVYAIYYTGTFRAYKLLAAANRDGRFSTPIYVGKAVPAGGRKGVAVASTGGTRALSARLREHARSIREVSNLDIMHFHARYLVVEPIWIPLGESLLIARHAPVWNAIVDGFGNHDPGAGRASGLRPMWDTIHPGRVWAGKYPERPQTQGDIERDASEYLRQRIQV